MTYSFIINIVAIATLLLLGIIMSVIWHGEQSPYLLREIISGLIVDNKAASAMTEPTEQYFFYGRMTLLFYAYILLQFFQLNGKMSKSIFWLSAMLLITAVIADFCAYWLSETYGVYLREIAFWYIELPSLLFLIFTWIGFALWKSRQLKVVDKMLWALPILLFSVIFLQYLPHALLLVILIITSCKTLINSLTWDKK